MKYHSNSCNIVSTNSKHLVGEEGGGDDLKAVVSSSTRSS